MAPEDKAGDAVVAAGPLGELVEQADEWQRGVVGGGEAEHEDADRRAGPDVGRLVGLAGDEQHGVVEGADGTRG